MEISNVPIGVAADAHVYLAQGGPDNLRQLHAFLCDTLLLTGVGFEPPRSSRLGRTAAPLAAEPSRSRIGILFYRAQYAAGNTSTSRRLPKRWTRPEGLAYDLCDVVARCPWDLLEYLSSCDALITTVLALVEPSRHGVRRRR
jgi:cobaltochelatase CobN